MNLDAPVFSLAEVASLLDVPAIKLFSNWTERGLCDPHASPLIRRRGRGRQRLYSARDLLRFALMQDLWARFAVPVPLGARICENALGDFNPARPGIFIVEHAAVDRITTIWCADPEDLARRLAKTSACSVLLVNTLPLLAVLNKAASAFAAKTPGRSNG